MEKIKTYTAFLESAEREIRLYGAYAGSSDWMDNAYHAFFNFRKGYKEYTNLSPEVIKALDEWEEYLSDSVWSSQLPSIPEQQNPNNMRDCEVCSVIKAFKDTIDYWFSDEDNEKQKSYQMGRHQDSLMRIVNNHMGQLATMFKREGHVVYLNDELW